jgi:hypothetical protein
MNPLLNPFTVGNKPEHAIVTPAKASRFFSTLTTEGGALGVYGERGMGKSLMLNYIASPPLEWQESYFKNYIFVFFNCQDTIIPATPSNFWLETTKQLDRRFEDGPIKNKCQALIARTIDGGKLNHNDFHEVLDVAAGANQRITLVLDDFDCLIRTDLENLDSSRAFLQGLRSLTTRDSNKASLVTATRSPLQELCKPLSLPNYSDFHNGFRNERVRCFSEKELLALLRRVEQTGQPPFSAMETRYVAYLSGTHPKLTQLVAAEIFNQRIEEGTPLSQTTLEEVIGERFKSESRSIFEGLWQGANATEQLLLMLIALQKIQGKLPTIQFDLEDLPEIFSKYEPSLIELTERGLLTRVQSNPPIWDIFSPVFQWWILKHIESSEPEQLEERRKTWGGLVTQDKAEKIGGLFQVIKNNWKTIEEFGRIILRFRGVDLPQLPGG